MPVKDRHRSQREIDERALDRFTEVMRHKLARSRAKGRDGWQDPSLCAVDKLASMMIGHLGKVNEGNLADIAIFSMMLHERGAHPTALLTAMAAPEPVRPICENKIDWLEGDAVAIDPVWIIDLDGVRHEMPNEAKARAMADAINARSRPRADVDLLRKMIGALAPLGKFADIPGADGADPDGPISKRVGGPAAPELTFRDATEARDLIENACARMSAFESMAPLEAAGADAVGLMLFRIRSDIEELPDGRSRDAALASIDTRLRQFLSAPDSPPAFRQEVVDRMMGVRAVHVAGPSRVELVKALSPFARLGLGEDGGDILHLLMSDRIKDWLGVSDFKRAREAMELLAGDVLPEPQPDAEPALT